MANAVLKPCPFSGYRIQSDQAWRLLAVFATYQLALGTLFVSLFHSHLGPSQLGQHNPELFLHAAYGYVASVAISLLFLWRQRPSYSVQATSHIFLDLALLPCIIYSCGGLGSGFAVLLAVSVVAAGLLIGGRCGVGFAALASLSVLAIEVTGSLQEAFTTTHYTYAAMLGVAYLTIAWLAVALAGRVEQSQMFAERCQTDLINLRHLNEFIVQHLQSGILVLDSTNLVRLCNDSALRLLGLRQKPSDLSTLPGLLVASLREWQMNPRHNPAVLLTEREPIQLRFGYLPMQGETLTMVFIEDNALYQQRVQEGKLASLGRLTASIAHEIRNPLSAVSHASQLLAESQFLGAQEKRLVEIIQKHCRRVNEIISNVLSLSRRQAACREKIELNTWLKAFCNEFQEANLRRELFELQLPMETLCALADPGQLKQILANLCGNALKYGTPEGEKITLKLCRYGPSQQPCIEVIDRGPGIPPDQIGHIFEPFFTTSATGTGLGLYIARELAQLNQAALEYEFGKYGSCFRVILASADQIMVEL